MPRSPGLVPVALAIASTARGESEACGIEAVRDACSAAIRASHEFLH